jgi:tRNA (guanine-N7-)-methyltransferase
MTFELLSPGKRLPADYWSRMAPGTRRTEIEIGPGDGRFLVEAARRDPATAWVGLEIRAGLARKLAQRPDRPGNAFVHQCDARWIVEHLIADASVAAFHLYFPDPWWKKRHYKRRLIGESFAAALVRSLETGGVVYLLSDVEGVFREGAELLEAAGLVPEPWLRPAEDPAQSSYERKYRRQGRRLYQARFAKKESRA